jgi:hypothetical protein
MHVSWISKLRVVWQMCGRENRSPRLPASLHTNLTPPFGPLYLNTQEVKAARPRFSSGEQIGLPSLVRFVFRRIVYDLSRQWQTSMAITDI